MGLENRKQHIAGIVHGVDTEIHNICMKHLPHIHEEKAWAEMSGELSGIFERYPGNDDFIAPIILAHLDIFTTLLDGKSQRERAAKTRRWLKDICG